MRPGNAQGSVPDPPSTPAGHHSVLGARLARIGRMMLRVCVASHFAAVHTEAISCLSREDAHRDPPPLRDLPMASTTMNHDLSVPEAEGASLRKTVRIYWDMAGAALRCAASVESGYRPQERDQRLLGIEGIMPLTKQIGR